MIFERMGLDQLLIIKERRQMKKSIRRITCLFFLFSVFACGNQSEVSNSDLSGNQLGSDKATMVTSSTSKGFIQDMNVTLGRVVGSYINNIGVSILSSMVSKITGFSIGGGGSLQEPVLANLSQQSLNEIRNIVTTEVKNALAENNMTVAFNRAQTLLTSIEFKYKLYKNRMATASYPPTETEMHDLRGYLQDIQQDSIDLLQNEIYNESAYPNTFWANTPTFVIAANLIFTVQMEMHHLGMDKSIKNITLVARNMSTKLASMNAHIRDYYYSQVIIESGIYPNNTSAWAHVYDKVTGQSFWYYGQYQGGYGPDDPYAKAKPKREELVQQHISDFGNYNDTQSMYEKFGKLTAWRNLFDNDLVGYWIFESTGEDVSKYINNGIQSGSIVYTAGMDGTAAGFAGSSYFQAADSDSLDIGTSDMTISFWIKTASTQYLNTIIDKRSNTSGYHLVLFNGRILVQIGDEVSGAYNFCNGASATVNDGTWHLVTVTIDRDSPTGLQIYRDAVLVATFDPTGHMGSLTNTAPLLIGKHKDSASYNFNGAIDELRIYKRALSADEVQRSFQYPGATKVAVVN
jgi:hypothetical protein